MATNLKKQEKEDKRAAKAEKGDRVPLDLKWVLAGLGLVAITMGSVIIGIQLAPNKVVIKETSTTEYVQKIPSKPGPAFEIVKDQVVNLTGGRYLRFSCTMQFAKNDALWPEGGGGGHGAKAVNPLDQYMALLKDTVVTVASKRTAGELLDSRGKERLKAAIIESVNHEFEALGGGHHDASASDEHPVPEVIRVYFTNFVIS